MLFYKFSPCTKILIVLLFTIVVFIIDTLPVAIFLLFLFLALRLTVKIPFKNKKTFKFLVMLVIFIIAMQTIFAPGENYILKPIFPYFFPVLGGLGSLKWEGVFLGLMLGCRLGALMLLLPMLTETTSPYRITRGLVSFGINYRAAFIISTAFNMIPLFEDEARAIMDTQKLRGMRKFDKGEGLLGKMKAYPSLVVPLVLGAMRKAQVSAVAMDSRAFGAYKTRTWLEKTELKIYDFIAITICFIFSVLILLWNNWY